MRRNYGPGADLRAMVVWCLVFLSGFLSGCVSSQKQVKYYPKVSLNAKILYNLHSNIQRTEFFVDGNKVATGRRVKIYIDDRPHTVLACPAGYRGKEEFIQPPYMHNGILSFTFLLEDRMRDGVSSEGPSPTAKAKPHSQFAEPPSGVPPSREGNSWAVVIGISKYKFSGTDGFSTLIFADDDAKAFARALRNLGWQESHIKLLTNQEATKRNIMIALESWLTKAGPSDQIILFWAGHGFPDPEDPEKVYFACYDTVISIPATGYRMDRVREALAERKTKNVVLLADTCHAGKLITRGKRGISIVPQVEGMRKEGSIPKGWIFMVGADTDREAIESSSWKNGAFTHSLLKGLHGDADGYESSGPKDGVVTLGELRAYMKSAMPDETHRVLGVAKHPIITTSCGDPDIWKLDLQIQK